jgi:hypothetical protein
LTSGSEDANRLSTALNISILAMLVTPYLLFATICGLMYRAVRRARREREAMLAGHGGTQHPPDAGPTGGGAESPAPSTVTSRPAP